MSQENVRFMSQENVRFMPHFETRERFQMYRCESGIAIFAWRITKSYAYRPFNKNFLVLLSTPLCSQNINKQNVNIADENLT